TTRQRLFAPGAMPSTKSTTTTPTAFLQTTVPNRRLRKRCKTHFVLWNCSARSVSTSSKPSATVEP
ncbi:hypothetical protein LTR16_005913, partial [Cryomyces antarcticus]